jgi:SRSO17 transposase
VAATLPEEAWIRVSAGVGSKGYRLYDWACVLLAEPQASGAQPQARRWLLMRRSIDDPTKLVYYLGYEPAQTTMSELIRIAGRRWAIEDSFEAAKGGVGLEEYEVRKWDGWHRHITLCLLAHAYLVVLRSVTEHDDEEEEGRSR